MMHDASTYFHYQGLFSVRIGENNVECVSRDGRKLYFVLSNGSEAAVNCTNEEEAKQLLVYIQKMLGFQEQETEKPLAEVVQLHPAPTSPVHLDIGTPTVVAQPPEGA